MMKTQDAPYVFSAYSQIPTCAAGACDTCKRANFFADMDDRSNPYARAYVVPQSYANCVCPEKALRIGTFFADLHMPYTKVTPRCSECAMAPARMEYNMPETCAPCDANPCREC